VASGEGASACSQSVNATASSSSDIKDMEKLILSLMSGDTSVLAQQLEGLDHGTSSGKTFCWSNAYVKLET